MTGSASSTWDIEDLLSKMYYLFKDSPARREDFTGHWMHKISFEILQSQVRRGDI